MLAEANRMKAEGASDLEISANIWNFVSPADLGLTKLRLHEKPAPTSIALHPDTWQDHQNLEKVLYHMEGVARIPVVTGATIMPDACPAGPGITVGGAVSVNNAIVPAFHSEDICCSMYASFFPKIGEVSKVMDELVEATHFGTSPRPVEKGCFIPPGDPHELFDNPFLKGLESDALLHLATQGDGNHFAFLGQVTVTRPLVDKFEELWPHVLDDVYVLVTHHGSRRLGAQVYRRGQKAAEKYTASIAEGIPNWGSWLSYDTVEGQEYWEALEYVAEWTRYNHSNIHRALLNRLAVRDVAVLHNQHNFVWKEGTTFYHGKGATPAHSGELGLIPLNMASPILLVNGRGAREFLNFAPHGAGRNESRTQIIKPFKDQFDDGRGISPREATRIVAEQTPGLDIRWYNGRPDLTETPLGYKDATQIKKQILDYGLADIVAEIQPLGCVMAGDSPRPWERKKKLKAEEDGTTDV